MMADKDEGVIFDIPELELVDNISEAKKLAGVSLLGKVITQRQVKIQRVINVARRLWYTEENVGVELVQGNIFLFTFKNVADRNRIWSKRPWSVDKAQLVLKEWNPDMNLQDVDFTKADFWVRVKGLALRFISEENARIVGSKIGRVLRLDTANRRGLAGRDFLRMQVEVDISKPLLTGFRQKKGDGCVWILIQYERLGDLCYNCGLLGHTLGVCKNPKLQVDGHGDVYGPFVRAEEGAYTVVVAYDGLRRKEMPRKDLVDSLSEEDSFDENRVEGVEGEVTSRLAAKSTGTDACRQGPAEEAVSGPSEPKDGKRPGGAVAEEFDGCGVTQSWAEACRLGKAPVEEGEGVPATVTVRRGGTFFETLGSAPVPVLNAEDTHPGESGEDGQKAPRSSARRPQDLRQVFGRKEGCLGTPEMFRDISKKMSEGFDEDTAATVTTAYFKILNQNLKGRDDEVEVGRKRKLMAQVLEPNCELSSGPGVREVSVGPGDLSDPHIKQSWAGVDSSEGRQQTFSPLRGQQNMLSGSPGEGSKSPPLKRLKVLARMKELHGAREVASVASGMSLVAQEERNLIDEVTMAEEAGLTMPPQRP